MGHSYILPDDGLVTQQNLYMWLTARLLNTQLCMMAKYHNRMIHFKVKISKLILLALLKSRSYT
jgi:hypothetical protein